MKPKLKGRRGNVNLVAFPDPFRRGQKQLGCDWPSDDETRHLSNPTWNSCSTCDRSKQKWSFLPFLFSQRLPFFSFQRPRSHATQKQRPFFLCVFKSVVCSHGCGVITTRGNDRKRGAATLAMPDSLVNITNVSPLVWVLTQQIRWRSANNCTCCSVGGRSCCCS